jgi:hypothetical protein
VRACLRVCVCVYVCVCYLRVRTLLACLNLFAIGQPRQSKAGTDFLQCGRLHLCILVP